MHKFSTASAKSLGLTVRPAKRVPTPSASSAYHTVRLRGPRSRVAQRTQASAFAASWRKPMH